MMYTQEKKLKRIPAYRRKVALSPINLKKLEGYSMWEFV